MMIVQFLTPHVYCMKKFFQERKHQLNSLPLKPRISLRPVDVGDGQEQPVLRSRRPRVLRVLLPKKVRQLHVTVTNLQADDFDR